MTLKSDAHYAPDLSLLNHSMMRDHDPIGEFRNLVNRRARQSPIQWDESRRLIDENIFPSTLDRLRRVVNEKDLPRAIKEQLRTVLGQDSRRVRDLASGTLKTLTGLPPTKALRALCIYFEMVEHPSARWPLPMLTSEAVEQHVREMTNPFDLLLHSNVASLLDLGSGDLSFADELVARYGPQLRNQHRELIVHCLDRLHPRSKLGGPLHAERKRLQSLQQQLGARFGFWGDQDMFDLRALDEQGKLAPRYTIVSCWAPATPTFAYEPSRLSRSVIEEDLCRTKGSFRHTRFDGEQALEVQHGKRILLFPAWKFDITGPLALLHLLASRGALCIVGSVDSQVFWEMLAQLLEDPAYRPLDKPFTADNLPAIFGELYQALDRLPPAEAVNLADLATLRTHIPAQGHPSDRDSSVCSFRYVQVRRGATFPGIPASSTARTFTSMSEEDPPWFLTLVPQ